VKSTVKPMTNIADQLPLKVKYLHSSFAGSYYIVATLLWVVNDEYCISYYDNYSMEDVVKVVDLSAIILPSDEQFYQEAEPTQVTNSVPDFLNFITNIRDQLKAVDQPRTPTDSFNHLCSEVTELNIELYWRYTVGKKNPNTDDDVFGETIDVIISAFDVLFLDRPDVSNEEILEYITKKINKWKSKVDTNQYDQLPDQKS